MEWINLVLFYTKSMFGKIEKEKREKGNREREKRMSQTKENHSLLSLSLLPNTLIH